MAARIAEFIGLSVLGLPVDPQERVRDALTLAYSALLDASVALPDDADPALARRLKYALCLTESAAVMARGGG